MALNRQVSYFSHTKPYCESEPVLRMYCTAGSNLIPKQFLYPEILKDMFKSLVEKAGEESQKEIKELKYEDDRVNKIIELTNK